MSKIEKSNSLFSLGERIWKYKVYLLLGISFISSLFSHVAAVFGWPATIIIITSLVASSFLLLLSFWKEFSEGRELRNQRKRKDIEFEYRIRGDIINISDKCTIGEIRPDQAKKMIEARVTSVAEEIKEIYPIMKVLCGGDEYSKDDYDKFYSLWKNFQPLQKNVANLLLTRAAPRIPTGKISKQAIEFLSSITDDDLDILKEQLKYVLQLPHKSPKTGLASNDLAIWHFENNELNVQDILLEENGLIHLESYHIKFYGDIWLGENDRISCHTPQDQQEVISDIDAKNLYVLQISIKEVKPKKGELVNLNVTQNIAINFSAYVCLSEIGTEIFNLLKDELKPIPTKYLNELNVYWSKANPQFDLKLISKPKLITNDKF